MLKSCLSLRPYSAALGALALLLITPGTSMAHHAMDGALPYDFTTGFVSGLAHPVIGLDHLAFVVAIGLLSIGCARRFLMPLAFVAFTILGTVLHLKEMALPAVELVIALTVLVAGGLIISRKEIPWQFAASLFAVAGMFHGYAYGESIFGAEATPMLSYLAGFATIQYAIAVGVMEGARYLIRRPMADHSGTAIRIAGGVVSGVAMVFLSNQLMPF